MHGRHVISRTPVFGRSIARARKTKDAYRGALVHVHDVYIDDWAAAHCASLAYAGRTGCCCRRRRPRIESLLCEGTG